MIDDSNELWGLIFKENSERNRKHGCRLPLVLLFEEGHEGYRNFLSRLRFQQAMEFNAGQYVEDHQSRVCELDWLHSYLPML